MSTAKQIVIEPELEIGTEFWILQNNKAKMGLIAGYKVHVTSCTENDSWHRQLFSRWLKGKAKEVYRYYYEYEVKMKSEIYAYPINNKNGRWFLYDTQIYFSMEDLQKSLTDK